MRFSVFGNRKKRIGHADMETYLDRIKNRKSELKMTNEQLSALSGIPLGTLSKILAGMSDSPKLANIVALSGALGCSVGYLVTGEPDNRNNYTLTEEEIRLIEDYRKLDFWGRSTVATVISSEAKRFGDKNSDALDEKPDAPAAGSAKILRPLSAARREGGKRSVKLFELPVSAGVGVYLDGDSTETITVPDSEKTAGADYALRIRGNSMEPRYHDGDILLVQSAERVEVGELGIFLLDGSGFFKVFGGDTLLSLNPDYASIPIREYSEFSCKGKVIGRLKRK